MDKKTYKELEAEGWVEEKQDPREVKAPTHIVQAKERKPAPYIVVDTNETIRQVGLANVEMTRALAEMTKSINESHQRPSGLKINITRNSSGFMDKVDIDLKY